MRDKGACSEAVSESPFVESREERGTSSSLLPGGRVGTKLERVGAEDRTRITVYWGEGAEEGIQGHAHCTTSKDVERGSPGKE